MKKLTLALFGLIFAACTQAQPQTATTQGAMMHIQIGNQQFDAELADSPTTAELKKYLPLVLTMTDLHRNEKYAALPHPLPRNDQAVGRIEAGDVLLYQGDTLVVFYESFSTPYRYTRIGKITHTEQLKNALGTGSATVGFSLK
ncbi:cyclophilin-like fold protein [Moraxella sp. ZJ142]|uniref:cyclophilin-like fold protein n=1 Tax=Moraxella marmotae TaxID=3344520 RepID=UPI0035D4CAC6